MEKDLLYAIFTLCNNELFKNRPMLVDDFKLLNKIVDYTRKYNEIKDKFIISCDYNFTNQTIGGIISNNSKEISQYFRETKSKTNVELTFDAMYDGLITLTSLINTPQKFIEIRCTNEEAINFLLNKEKSCSFENKRDSLLELINSLPSSVILRLFPTNSTDELIKIFKFLWEKNV